MSIDSSFHGPLTDIRYFTHSSYHFIDTKTFNLQKISIDNRYTIWGNFWVILFKRQTYINKQGWIHLDISLPWLVSLVPPGVRLLVISVWHVDVVFTGRGPAEQLVHAPVQAHRQAAARHRVVCLVLHLLPQLWTVELSSQFANLFAIPSP